MRKLVVFFVVILIGLGLQVQAQTNPYPNDRAVVDSTTWLAWTPDWIDISSWHEISWKYEIYKKTDSGLELARWGFVVHGPVVDYIGSQDMPTEIKTPPFINLKVGVQSNFWTKNNGFIDGEYVWHVGYYENDVMKWGPEWSFTVVSEKKACEIQKFILHQNYPNPFNPETTITYSIAKAGNVRLTVYNVLGQKVADLVDEYKAANTYKVFFDASNLVSGIYFYRLEINDYSKTMKMFLSK